MGAAGKSSTPRRWSRVVGAVAVGAGAVAFQRQRRRDGTDTPGRPLDGLGGRAQRSAELAKLGSRAGTRFAVSAAKGVLAPPERREELRREFELHTAADAVAALGGMKGAAMKVGQMASYLDPGLPEPVRDALAQLQSSAPPMSHDLAASVIRDAFGEDPDSLFSQWEPDPIAAASIGQVHWAVTKDGREVAVKVQYPGVDTAVRSDLDNGDLLFGALGVLFPGMDPGPIVSELKARISEELDYRIEAAHQRRFFEAYRGHPTIHIPAVIDELSTDKVLTTEFAHGATFAEVRDTWSDVERNLAGETMYRFAFGGIYDLGMFNGDPHPGNYLFRPGGRVTFLDYGLCKVFAPDEVIWFERLIQAMVLDRDMVAFGKLCEELGLIGDASAFSEERLYDYFSHFYELVLADEVMTVSSEYASESIRRFFDRTGPYADLLSAVNLPPSMVIIQRINLGLFSLLADLGATANWRGIAEDIWPFVESTPSTPMGHSIERWRQRRAEGDREPRANG